MTLASDKQSLTLYQKGSDCFWTDEKYRNKGVIESKSPMVRSTSARFVKIRINRFQLDQFFPITTYLFPDSERLL